jgi:hypothetical protein
MPDMQQMAGDVIAAVKTFVSSAVEKLSPRIESLEKRLAELPAPEKGEPGKDADIADLIPTMESEIAKRVEALPDPAVALVPFIDERVADAVAAIEKPQGVTVDQVMPALIEALKQAVAELPKPEPGKDADPEFIRQQVAEAVAEMPRPEDGKSVTIEELQPAIAEQVEKAVKALPAPQPGKDATHEQVEAAVLKALSSPTPPSFIAEWLSSKSAAWELDFERRAQGVLERAAERIPKPKDGTDGVGFDDLTVEHDGARNVVLRFVKGDQVKEFPLTVPALIYRGVFTEGKTYDPGDVVTWGGSMWHCDEASASKPGEPGTKGWTLSVKRGSPGKDGQLLAPREHKPVKL